MSDDFENFLSGGSKQADEDDMNPDVQGASPVDQTVDFGSINLDEIDETQPDFPVIQPGWYPAIIINVEPKMSSNGNPMIAWNFEMQGEHKGRQQFYNTVTNKESGLKRLKKLLIAIVPDFDFREFNPKQFAESGVALGKPCMIKLKVGTYNGKATNNVNDVAPYNDQEEL